MMNSQQHVQNLSDKTKDLKFMKRRTEEAEARKYERQKQKALAASKWSINTRLEQDIPYIKKESYHLLDLLVILIHQIQQNWIMEEYRSKAILQERYKFFHKIPMSSNNNMEEDDNDHEELEDRIDEEEWEVRQKTLIHKSEKQQQPKFSRSSRGGRNESGNRGGGRGRGRGRGGKRNNH